ncbi:uncharacterized protein Triagg1_7570 [Trichoderma aggressivum f. europaeum]|uniref:Uncharacterized protein n=1 Tax=Trichoderma aggressivum f. europaeum TaxID=173218 RepID=A0AAE1LYH6_9HYPO|nr:hypothetical protein Triagg1_7570 [Trichoderma aggressivum f. europaeum]
MAEAKVNWQPNRIFSVIAWQIHLTAALFQIPTLPNFEQNSFTKQHHSAQQTATANVNKSGITATNLFQKQTQVEPRCQTDNKFASASGYAQEAAAAAAAAAAAIAPTSATAPPPPPPPAPAAATPPAATNRNPSDSTEEPRTSWR